MKYLIKIRIYASSLIINYGTEMYVCKLSITSHEIIRATRFITSRFVEQRLVK